MRAIRRITVAVSLALAAAAMGGCAGPASPPPPEPAPLFASDEEAFAAAEATYRAYEDASNAVDLSAPESFQPMFDLTAGDFNAMERKGLARLHAEGITKQGETRVIYVEAQHLAADHSRIEIAVCSDVSAVNLLDATGSSTVNPDRLDVQPFTVFLERAQVSPTGWFIIGISAHEGTARCGL